ncbi:hypothetical protein [Parasphingorhabdus sp.]|uniref:hypothetical protein n=1 Tax=Parasphingorhabdus sp. TaxID=2709688 RepID=UPI003266F0ED
MKSHLRAGQPHWITQPAPGSHNAHAFIPRWTHLAKGSWKSAVRWQIPAQAPNLSLTRQAFSLPLPHGVSTTSKITLVREKDGSISSCKFEHFVTEEQGKALCEQAKWKFGKNMPNGLVKDRVKIVVSTTTKTEISLAESDEQNAYEQ